MATQNTFKRFRDQDYEALHQRLKAENRLFEDDVFPAVNDSIYYDESFTKELGVQSSDIIWLRPGVSTTLFF